MLLPPSRQPFLTARWSKLCILTYAVPPSVLQPRVPPGLELDTRDGRAFVSLVTFDFLDARALGVAWPGLRDFPELNLRYYVRWGTERGVVFIREYVPRRLVSWAARALYNEPYATADLESTVSDDPTHLAVERSLRVGGRRQTIAVTGAKPARRPSEDSDEHFFKEHRWGFGVTRRGRTIRYEVAHPVWDVYPVQSYRVEIDWAQVFGATWSFLAATPPSSVVLAEGSPVALYPKARLR